MSEKTATVTIEIRCAVDSKHFGVPVFFDAETREFWHNNWDDEKYTYCGRTGEMGMNCQGCPFCTRFELETIES